MAALGQTISGVAHELNNPLATILSWAERLSQKTAVDASVRRGLETILSESERAARIVRNLLTFARKRQTTRAMVDRQPGGPRDARAARRRAAGLEHHRRPRAGGRPATGIRRRLSVAAGAAQSGHQRRTGDALGARARGAGGPHLARRRPRVGDARNQRRWTGNPGRGAAEDLRPVLHHQGCRQGNGTGPDRRVRDRPGARRPDPAGVARGSRDVVLCRAAGDGREAVADAGRARGRVRRSNAPPARRSWSSRTKRRSRPRSPTCCRTPGYVVERAADGEEALAKSRRGPSIS